MTGRQGTKIDQTSYRLTPKIHQAHYPQLTVTRQSLARVLNKLKLNSPERVQTGSKHIQNIFQTERQNTICRERPDRGQSGSRQIQESHESRRL